MSATGSEEFDPRDFLTNFRRIALGVLMSPRAFFPEMRRSGGFGPPLLFMLTCLGIHTIIVGLLHMNLALMGPNLLPGVFFPLITAGLLQ